MVRALALLLVIFTPLAYAAHNVTLDDDDPSIQYSSNDWTVLHTSDYIGGSTHWATTPNATAQFDFTGSAIYYIGDQNVDHGFTEISLDGVKTTVLTYAPTLVYQVMIFSRTGLPNTSHRLIIRQAESSPFSIVIDHLIYTVEDSGTPTLPSSRSLSALPSTSSIVTSATPAAKSHLLPPGSVVAVALGSAIIGAMLLQVWLLIFRRRWQQEAQPSNNTGINQAAGFRPLSQTVPAVSASYPTEV